MTPFYDILNRLFKDGKQDHLFGYPDSTDFLWKLKIKLRNFDVNEAAQILNLLYTPEPDSEGEVCFANNRDLRDDFRTSFTSMDLLDYIYATLYSRQFHEQMCNNAGADVSSVPYPEDVDEFWKLVRLGNELRRIHLLKHSKVTRLVHNYPISDTYPIESPPTIRNFDFELTTQDKHVGRILINDVHYIDNVPKEAWELYIGGCRPAIKWLKDRLSEKLNYDKLLHYQKIIAALAETVRLMKEIDKIEIE